MEQNVQVLLEAKDEITTLVFSMPFPTLQRNDVIFEYVQYLSKPRTRIFAKDLREFISQVGKYSFLSCLFQAVCR